MKTYKELNEVELNEFIGGMIIGPAFGPLIAVIIAQMILK